LGDLTWNDPYARKPFKESEDADHSLVSKKDLSQKNGSLGWHPQPGKVRIKLRNHALIVMSTQKTPNPKKIFFQSQLADLLNA